MGLYTGKLAVGRKLKFGVDVIFFTGAEMKELKFCSTDLCKICPSATDELSMTKKIVFDL